jgi:hypothetical protein
MKNPLISYNVQTRQISSSSEEVIRRLNVFGQLYRQPPRGVITAPRHEFERPNTQRALLNIDRLP